VDLGGISVCLGEVLEPRGVSAGSCGVPGEVSERCEEVVFA
jgi:hypothetical protein